MLDSRLSPFPMEQQHKLVLDSGSTSLDLYLTNTRLELGYSVHTLSQFIHDPQKGHWNATMKVLRYIKQSPGQDILS